MFHKELFTFIFMNIIKSRLDRSMLKEDLLYFMPLKCNINIALLQSFHPLINNDCNMNYILVDSSSVWTPLLLQCLYQDILITDRMGWSVQ
jgi:hypothetical protein